MSKCIRLLGWILPAMLLAACNNPPATQPATDTPTATFTYTPVTPTPTFTDTPIPPTPTETNTPGTKTFTKTISITITRSFTPSKTDTPSGTPAPSRTRTAGATPAADIEVELGVVTFTIPGGLAASATLVTTTREEWPYVNPSIGPLPEHWVVTLQGYAVKGSNIAPQIIIFHADEFEEFSAATGRIIAALRQLQNRPDDPVPPDLMISRFSAHLFKLPSDGGMGARYLTQFFMAYFPVNNKDFFYYYVGLSADGGYYISMMLPVHASFLPADSNVNTPLPAGGIPFPEDVNGDSFAEYLQQVSAKVNATKAEDFTPSLLLLDDLAKSIRIG